ncbi:MAG: clostripain-related cysteine peptidase, partial [Candidatus Sericytochromatia bacterium]
LAQGAAPLAHWTVMVYMSGDNDLEEYVVKDIENELGLGGSTDQVQVVALADRIPGYDTSRGDWTGTKLFHVTRGLRAEPAAAVADWGERSMGDPATLVDFVSWSKAHYPAEHYALYMWGHGWSWHPGYVMEDKTNHDALDPQEIKSIFPRLGALDLVAYDGCNMAAIEVESLWHGHATALVHSQEYVEWDGIEYDVVLGQLNQNPRMGADQLAIISNRSASLNQEKTGSAVAVDGRFDRLLQAIDHWSLALISGLPRYRAEYARAFAAAQHFFEAPDEKDLYHLASLIRQQVPDPAIQAASQELFTAFGSVMLNEWHSGDYPQAHGITISNPAPEDGEVDSYRSGDFARYTHWDEFLAAYRR